MILSILIFSVIIGATLLIMDGKRSMETQEGMKRNSYGEGEKTREYNVTADGKKIGESIDVTVGEKQYTEEEMQDVFDRSIEKLEILALGTNESWDEVREDLDLNTAIPNEPVEVEWQIDRYDIININGEIRSDKLEEEKEGVLVNLQAYLTYTEDKTRQVMHEMTARIYPRKKTSAQKLIAGIQEEIRKKDNENKTKDTILFPEEVGGKKLTYRYPMDFRGLVVLVMGVVIAGLLICLEKQDTRTDEKERQRQMMMDYPEIVSQLNLLLGAGMTGKNAWRKIVEDYRGRKDTTGVRYAYEEMESAWNEMQSGVGEKECYEKFGRRCRLQAYMKLGALLSQNVRKGTKGIADLLRIEGIHAFEERKALAKRQGEEAGTKLLLPMFFMLGIVLVIVIVPAFLSIQF